MPNTTNNRPAPQLLDLIEQTCSGEVDLDGCCTAGEIRDAITRDAPALLAEHLVGDASHDPTLAEWLDERGADIETAIAER